MPALIACSERAAFQRRTSSIMPWKGEKLEPGMVVVSPSSVLPIRSGAVLEIAKPPVTGPDATRAPSR